MTIQPFNYIYQINSYGCGCFAVMNAINYGMAQHGFGLEHQFDYQDIPALEEILETDEEVGTEEKPMVKFLRNFFYVSIKKKFSKKSLDKWLEKGNQVIVLYPYAGKYELHYSNIFQRRVSYKGEEYYNGANFWFKNPNNKLWSMTKNMPKFLLKSMYHSETVVLYLRWRGGDDVGSK